MFQVVNKNIYTISMNIIYINDFNIFFLNSAEGSIAPTPATSPTRGGSPALPEAVEEGEEEGEVVNGGVKEGVNGVEKKEVVEDAVDGVRELSVTGSPPPTPGEWCV